MYIVYYIVYQLFDAPFFSPFPSPFPSPLFAFALPPPLYLFIYIFLPKKGNEASAG